ncbi:hypothetical protein ACODT5_14430 [Streptomyces sp. 5.8]|uniref:hypothetical protein n=1 Tax=Streptomyces sp. 5.8 TaxID=3406571 RepID=UPI003BB766D6
MALQFASYVSTLAWAPTEVSHLVPEHLDGFYDHRRKSARDASRELSALKLLLAETEGLSDATRGKLKERSPRRPAPEAKESYSRAEMRRIADAARVDLRAAAARIRRNRALLRQVQEGQVPPDVPARALEVLEHVHRVGDVPRVTVAKGANSGYDKPRPWVAKLGPAREMISWLHLSADECVAGAVLMAVMTGQNRSVLMKTKAVHHRADGHTGGTGTAIIRQRKKRRGNRAHMTLVLSDIPDWISIPDGLDELSARDELHTPFGLYVLLHELTSRSREITGSDLLFLGWRGSSPSQGRGLATPGESGIAAWAKSRVLLADARDAKGKPVRMAVTFDLLRLSHVELHQKPVAHTEQTLATDYLARNRGNITAYRRVVAAALDEEVSKATARAAMATLTRDDLEQAHTDIEAVAHKYGVNILTLRKMIDGELDTVMNACVDHENSPQAPAGEPCRASFMVCLGCPCARALPRHLPVQVLVHDRLEARKDDMTPLQWVRRFSGPQAQLSDLMDRHGPTAVDDARAAVSESDRAMVTRFLNRELDLR